ncbi:MAG: 30S ribosomal protein S20 [Patescibacteria group bacterium]|nr:30S ribosomal protein S20 [Patescibacteria group bacterium]
MHKVKLLPKKLHNYQSSVNSLAILPAFLYSYFVFGAGSLFLVPYSLFHSMPITSSAKKALRQNRTRRSRNILKKEAYKKLIVSYRKMIAGKKTDDAKAKLPAIFKALDKAAKTNVIAKNKAARLKSRLALKLAR